MLRLLRPARPQGDVPADGPGAPRLGGRQQRRGRAAPRRRASRAPGCSPRRRACRPTSPRWSPGRTHSVHDEHDGIPLGIYCRQSLAQHLDPEDLFTVTKQGFDFFDESSATATRSASTTSSSCRSSTPAPWRTPAASPSSRTTSSGPRSPTRAYERRAETILHEMAHMWFGDLVTMRWWDDLWLNESLRDLHVRARPGRGDPLHATAGRRSPTGRRPGRTGRTSCRRRTRSPRTSSTSRPSRSTSTASPTPRAPRCSSSWSPGSGRTPSCRRCRPTSGRTSTATPTLADLLGALEATSGRDLSDWSAEWLETAGVNTLRPVRRRPRRRADLRHGRAGGARARPTLRSHRLAIGCYDLVDGGLRRTSPSRARRRRRQHARCPALVGRRRPTWCS